MNLKIFYILLLISCSGYAQMKSLDSIRSHIFKTEKVEKTIPQGDTLKVEGLLDLGRKHLYRHMDSVKIYAENAKLIADRLGYEKGQIGSRYLLAILLTEEGRNENAFVLIDESMDIATGCRDKGLIMACYINYANIHAYTGDIKSSNENFNEAIALAEKKEEDILEGVYNEEDRKYMLSLANEGLAANYFVMKNYEKALEYINKADKLNQQIGDDLSTGQTLANKAEICLADERYEDALIHINESIELFIEKENMEWQAFAERVKGDIFFKQEYDRLALEAYEKAEKLQNQLEDGREKAFLDLALAKVYHLQNKNDLASKHAKMALDKALILGELSITSESSEILFNIYEQKGDSPTALFYHKLFKKYNDSLFNENNLTSMATREIELESDAKMKRAQNKQRLLLFASTAAVLILLTVLFLTQRSRKLERKLNDLLSKKNRVLGRRELQLKWLNDTKNKLFSIISHDLRAPIASLNNLIDLLNDKQIGPEEFIDFAPELSDQVKNVSFTLNNLLLWSKQQMKGARNNPKKHNLSKLAGLSIDLLIHQAQQKQIVLRNEIPKEAEVYADADQLTIVFRNLISNAIKFTESEGVIILKAEEKEGVWEVEVKDTGIGMDQRTIDRILSQSSSYMESTYGTNNEKGTGIGLSLCKEMITKSGGEFQIESAIGVGSSFYFTLEKYEEEVQEIPEPTNVLN